MKNFFFVLGCLAISTCALGQDFPVDPKKGNIVFTGSKQDTSKIAYDLKQKVREWLKTTAKENARGFSFQPDKNQFTGTIYTVLKYKDVLGKEQRFPLYFTMNIQVVESALLNESTYKYQLQDFDILSRKKKYFPAERLLLKGEDDQKNELPSEALYELKTQASDFINTLLSGFHQAMLSGLPEN